MGRQGDRSHLGMGKGYLVVGKQAKGLLHQTPRFELSILISILISKQLKKDIA